ncbi:DnaB-like helicase C-terminal domain-containing protein [Kitasatospora fiedleri]|uniref:DnaB-like helicase C-terminal domain-containing protein n=1 Tax=Kitasatospora fiedleri TaxID=2991545 RepID=UPI002499CC40|nr:DnaB-like helicase C-terminal domain-containing protein [Kitasatospora fiedleri]
MAEQQAGSTDGRDETGEVPPWALASQRPRVPSPWPDFDRIVGLYEGKLVGLGTFKGRREAAAGLELAIHAAANGHSTVLFAPDLPHRNPVPRLRVDHSPELTPARIRSVVDGMASRREPAQLVVVDHFGLLQRDPQPVAYDDYDQWDDDEPDIDLAEQEAGEIARELKHLAKDHHVPIVVMAHLIGAFDRTTPLDLDRLGIAAVLEYDADAVLLLRRTDATQVSVHVAKDRSGPAPLDTAMAW